jgi:hypothetical protein
MKDQNSCHVMFAEEERNLFSKAHEKKRNLFSKAHEKKMNNKNSLSSIQNHFALGFITIKM